MVISDDISEVIENCNRILIMKRGRICDEVKNTEVTESQLLEKVTQQAWA